MTRLKRKVHRVGIQVYIQVHIYRYIYRYIYTGIYIVSLAPWKGCLAYYYRDMNFIKSTSSYKTVDHFESCLFFGID